MRYLGGKSRIAKQISEVMLAATGDRARYVEPFMGGGAVSEIMVPNFDSAYLSDAAQDLIELWRALQRGWIPPEVVTEAEYQSYREAPPSAERGFAGYACSFGAKWFGGYARGSNNNGESRNYVRESRDALVRQIAVMRGANFKHASYRDLVIFNGSVVYLDPPYKGTTGYKGTAPFDHDAFWQWAAWLSRRASVFVSEYSAPSGWVPIWSGTPHASLSLKDKSGHASENLWTLGIAGEHQEALVA